MDEISKRVLELQRANCGHVCHQRGLNVWVEACPVCGCPNPKHIEGVEMCRGCWDYPCVCDNS